jgi:hypothetical protein
MVTSNQAKSRNNRNDKVKPELTDMNVQYLGMLAKKLKILSYHDVVKFTRRQLTDCITSSYPNLGTQEQMAYSLKKYFLNKHWKESRTETLKNIDVKYWSDWSSKKTAELADKEDNQATENKEVENWKTQDEIIRWRDEQKDKYEATGDKTAYNRYVLLAMTTLQPPLRNDFYCTCKWLSNPKDDNGTDNYVLLQTKRGKKSGMYIVNNDKVTNKAPQYKSPSYKHLPIESDELVDILFKFKEAQERTYIFETMDNKQYSNETIYQVLLYRPFKLNFHILRSSYITAVYIKYPNDNRVQKKLAKQMRHDREMAMTKYYKKSELYKQREEAIEDAVEIVDTDEKQNMIQQIYSKLTNEEIMFLSKLIK